MIVFSFYQFCVYDFEFILTEKQREFRFFKGLDFLLRSLKKKKINTSI